MKKVISIRKKYRKKMLKKQAQIKKFRRIEKTDFLQWGATTVNGVKQ